jgi:hypothetical protein
MSMKKNHTEAQIRQIFNKQRYKYACMKNEDGKAIVTYNTDNGKPLDKVNEAFHRLENLPDGMYTFCFANSKGRNVQPDEFLFTKGNVVISEDGKKSSYQVIHQPPTRNDYDKVLSYPEVIKLQMDLVAANFKLTATEQELAKANKTILELESELASLEAKGLSEGDPNSPQKWMEMLATNAMPVLTEYMQQRDRELKLREREFMAKHHNKRPPKQRKKEKAQPPEIGSDDWELLLDQLEAANDQDYNETMVFLQENYPQHYEAAIAELETDNDDAE